MWPQFSTLLFGVTWRLARKSLYNIHTIYSLLQECNSIICQHLFSQKGVVPPYYTKANCTNLWRLYHLKGVKLAFPVMYLRQFYLNFGSSNRILKVHSVLESSKKSHFYWFCKDWLNKRGKIAFSVMFLSHFNLNFATWNWALELHSGLKSSKKSHF